MTTLRQGSRFIAECRDYDVITGVVTSVSDGAWKKAVNGGLKEMLQRIHLGNARGRGLGPSPSMELEFSAAFGIIEPESRKWHSTSRKYQGRKGSLPLFFTVHEQLVFSTCHIGILIMDVD